MQTSNFTQYELGEYIKGSPLNWTTLSEKTFDTHQLNETFSNCLKINQKVQYWLQSEFDG